MGVAGSGGRNAKTVKELAAAGTYRPDRHGGVSNPSLPEGKPERPKELEGDAAQEWDRMVWRLEQSGCVSPIEDGVLYQHCCLFAETEQLAVEKAEALIAVETLLASQGDIEKADLLPFFIEVGKMKKLAAGYDSKLRSNRVALIRSYGEFGLTPAARARVKVMGASANANREQPVSPLAKLQAQARSIRAIK